MQVMWIVNIQFFGRQFTQILLLKEWIVLLFIGIGRRFFIVLTCENIVDVNLLFGIGNPENGI